MDKKGQIKIMHTTALSADGITSFVLNVAALTDKNRFVVDDTVYRQGKELYEERFCSYGGKKYTVDIWNIRSKPFKMWKKFWGSYHVLRQAQTDIFHLDTESTDQLFLAFAAKLAGVKAVFYHSHSTRSGRNGMLRKIIEMICKPMMPLVVDEYLACSQEAAASVFPKHILKKKKYRLINNGIIVKDYIFDPKVRAEYRKKFGLDDKLVLGHVGRFVPLKNQSFLVDVLEALCRKGQDAVLVLIGEGETQDSVRAKVKEKNMEDKVLFLGVREDVRKLLQMMDVFVFPSEFEGLPLAGIEVQAAGLPCLASDGISKDMKITDYVEYLPLDKGADIWAEHVWKLSKKERRDTGEVIRKAGYDIEYTVKILSAMYEKVCQ